MFGKFKNEKWRKFRDSGSLLTVLTVIGVAIGVALGVGLKAVKSETWTQREVMYLRFVGDLFLRTLSALILPLIVSSLVDAIGSLDLSLSKRIGTRALVYYLLTTAVAAVLGIILGVSVQPGNQAEGMNVTCQRVETSTEDTLLDLVRNIFPNNLVGATLEVSQTQVNMSQTHLPLKDRDLSVVMVPGTNMLGLVVFAMVLGITLGKMKSTGQPVLYFFRSLGEATMQITTAVVSFSPVAICSLVAAELVKQDDLAAVFTNMAWYFGTVLLGLIIHGGIVLPLLYFFLTRSSPIRFLNNMFQSLATAFGTASSSATLPVTMRCLEEKNKIDTRVTRFVVPIGATVNMNGTAIYLPVGAIYIAQLCGITLSIGELISVSLISIATSIGAAGIPQVGMVIMLTVLSSVGLPPEHISYIVPIDWLLERFRTIVNVLGDSFGAGIVAHLSKGDLENIPLENSTTDSSNLSLSTDQADKNKLEDTPYV